MAYSKKITIPRISPDVDEVRLVSWNVEPGAFFKPGDVLCEVETDKSVIEIPAEEAGAMQTHLCAAGDTVDFDTPVAEILAEGDSPVAIAPEGEAALAPAVAAPPPEAPVATPVSAPQVPMDDAPRGPAPERCGTRMIATPVARKWATDVGVSLQGIEGTGPNGRVTRSDVQRVAGVPAAAGAALFEAGRTRSVDIDTPRGRFHAHAWAPKPQAAVTQAPMVVLLHGIFGDVDTWASTVSGLSKAGLRGLAIDLPGHGKTACRADSFDEVVEAVVAALDRVVAGPLALIGHSFGAAVAARVASRLSSRVHSLGLIAPAGLGTEINQSFLDGVLHAQTREALARELEKLTAKPVPISDAYLDVLAGGLRERHALLQRLTGSVGVRGIQQMDIREDLMTLGAPVVILQGRSDAVIPWRHALNAPPVCALHFLKDAGHMPHGEAPGVSLDILVDMLKR